MTDPILIEKNSREFVRASVDEFKGRVLLSCYVWFKPGDGGDLCREREAWTIAVEKLPELIAGLQRLDPEGTPQ